MTQQILIAVLVLGVIGAFFAVVLYFVAQKFKVVEDPLIDEVAEVLPGANCGGCGKAGCRAFAEACVAQGNLEGLRCAPGGDPVAQKIAVLLGCSVEQGEPQVAVVRCNPANCGEKRRSNYDGLRSCAFANTVYTGESGCPFGCLGCGDCVAACQFDAIHMGPDGNYRIGSLVRLCDINRPLWERFLFVCLFTFVKAVKYRSLLPFKHFRSIIRSLPTVRAHRSASR